MIIKLADENTAKVRELFLGARTRLASATGVKLLDARRMLVNSCCGQRIHLIEFDVATGAYRMVSSVTTEFNGRPWMTDLLDYDGREFIITSDCGKCSVSVYRLAGEALSFVKNIPLALPDSGFCHGARFVPPGDVICATFSTGQKVIFARRDSGQVVYEFSTGEWRPKDAYFISPTQMVLLSARGTPGETAQPAYESKVSLITLDLPARRHTVTGEIITPDCHVDACCHAAGRIYVNNQMRDSLLVFFVEGGRLVFDREQFGYDFPHGVDALHSANLLAVTNYGSNTIFLNPLPPSGTPALRKDSRVLAVVSHYRCEPWLEQCLASLTTQSRPPNNIVVIDDASPQPPLDIVKKFPQATLLAAPENVGPYQLLEQVVCDTDCDAILLQDADDWSAPERLAHLLAEAEATGADLVSSQFVDVFPDGRHVPYQARPANVNAAYAADPAGHFACFGAALISRRLVQRLGGFAGLRFSGDAEFFRRAYHVGTLVNVAKQLYFRRKHPNSLTQRPDTGMGSPARTQLDNALKVRARDNAVAVAAGRAADLAPFVSASPVKLTQLCGPALRPAPAPSVFIIGMHRSGTSLTANLLRQCGLWLGEVCELHGATPDNPDGHWEHKKITEINDALLNELGGGWDDVPNFPAGWLNGNPALRERAERIHAGLMRPLPWGWKDPRASLVMPFWRALCPDARVVLCIRNPLEVAHSLHRRGMMSYSLGLKLWKAYNQRLLADVERTHRIAVHYDQFFKQPARTIRRLVDFCRLKVSDAAITEVAATIKPELRHTRFNAVDLVESRVAPEVLGLYAELCQEAGFAESPGRPLKDTTVSPRQIDLDALAWWVFLKEWNWSVTKHTRAGAKLAVVSKGDEDLVRFSDRTASHFPGDDQGDHSGGHPADSAEAIMALQAAVRRGAEYLIFPAYSAWWLDHYPEFHHYLKGHFTRLVTDPRICIIFSASQAR